MWAGFVPCRRRTALGRTLPLRKLPQNDSVANDNLCRISANGRRMVGRCPDSLQFVAWGDAPLLWQMRDAAVIRVGAVPGRSAFICRKPQRSKYACTAMSCFYRGADKLDASVGRLAGIQQDVAGRAETLTFADQARIEVERDADPHCVVLIGHSAMIEIGRKQD